ncbi:MAG: DUF4358 domain-containing protein [Erysipelotrichaceae bacterium]|nr:DUF4358 domain-containing protein [Erysipelotrichaceae bacterium]
MLKKFVSSLLVLVMVVGCTPKETVNDEEVKEEIIEQLDEIEETLDEFSNETFLTLFTFSDNMVEVDETTAKMLIDFEGSATLIKMFMSDTGKADMVALFDCEDVEATKQAVNTYLEECKGQAASYTPEELDKLNNALIIEDEGCLWVVVTDDVETAEKTIKGGINITIE